MYPPWTSIKCLCFDIIISCLFNKSTLYSWRPCKSIPDCIFPIYSWFQSVNIDQALRSARCWSKNGNASTYKTKPLLPWTLHTLDLLPSQILSHTYFFSLFQCIYPKTVHSIILHVFKLYVNCTLVTGRIYDSAICLLQFAYLPHILIIIWDI